MKTRNGFVSNSSSSSFVVIGYEFEDGTFTDEQIEDFYDKGDYMVLQGEEGGIEDGKIVIGEAIVDVSNDGDCLESSKYSLADIIKMGDKLKKDLKAKGELQLFVGTRAS